MTDLFSVAAPALLWLLVVEVVGLAAFPLAARVLPALPGAAWASAKVLGLVLVGYLAWITGMLGLTGFTAPTIAALALALGVGGWLAWRQDAVRVWRQERALAVGAEASFVGFFGVGVWIRSYNAAIAGTEKPMDFTFLHSLIQSRSLPAEDLWLAGHGLPYYYFGYLVQSLVAKVTGIEPAVAYNLAVAGVWALAAVGAFGLAAALIRVTGAGARGSLLGGGCSAFALGVMGNLEALFEMVAAQGYGDPGLWSAIGIKNLAAHGQGFPPVDGGWWFKAARVIPNIQPDGITEFPYFSFLLGDLHPHYMAILLGVLIATLAGNALTLALSQTERGQEEGAGWWSAPIPPLVAAIVLGSVIPTNTWDVPIFWGVFALGRLGAAAIRPGHLGAFAGAGAASRWKDGGARLALLLAAAALLYSPYLVGYGSQPLGIGLVEERTLFGSLFVLFGPLLVLPAVAGLAAGVRPWALPSVIAEPSSAGGQGRPPLRIPGDRPALLLGHWTLLLVALAAAGVVAGLALALRGEPTLGFLIGMAAVWGVLAWTRARSGASPCATMAAILTFAGLGSILVPEVVFLRDAFATRMNTVFKFYYDAWLLLALAAPLLAWELATAVREAGPGKARAALRPVAAVGLAAAIVLAAGGAIYPITATHTKSGGFGGAPTLDGMALLRASRPDDAAAIDWLRRTHPGAPLVEAAGNPYSDAGRFATFAASPTLLGWANHENQWRGPHPAIQQRQDLARRVYVDADPSTWREALHALGVRFVVFGGLERERYGEAVEERLQGVLSLAHRAGGTSIYALSPPRSPDR